MWAVLDGPCIYTSGAWALHHGIPRAPLSDHLPPQQSPTLYRQRRKLKLTSQNGDLRDRRVISVSFWRTLSGWPFAAGSGSVQFRGAVLDFCVSGVLGWELGRERRLARVVDGRVGVVGW